MSIAFPTLAQQNSCYDNTKISAYKVCPRSYFLRHIQHWRPSGVSLALNFGLAWHDGQDIMWKYAQKFNVADLAEMSAQAFNKTWQEKDLPLVPNLDQQNWMAPRTPQVAHEMYYQYATKRWNMLQEAEVFAIEQPFAVPLPNIPNCWYIGRLDKGVKYNGKKLILEHKTTTAYAIQGNFQSYYVESWYTSSQVKGYQFGGNLFYQNVNEIWVDAALVHKKVHDAFKFIPVAFSFPLLEEWILGTEKWVGTIIAEEERYEATGCLTPDMFRKNEESCFGKFGPCPYIDICRSVADPTKLDSVPGGFVEEKWEPFSVLKLDKLVQELVV